MNYEWPEITKDTPLEEVKRIHQKIWDYAIEHGGKPDTPYMLDCVLCEYDDYYDVIDGECHKCPAQWPENQYGEKLCSRGNGLYYRWLNESNPEKKKELGKQIRDLPFYYELKEDSQKIHPL